MLYMVSYDLRKPGQDYKSLIDELERLGGKKVLKSEWALRQNNTSASDLRDHLRQFIDSNDRLLVVAVSDWAAWNAMIDINDI